MSIYEALPENHFRLLRIRGGSNATIQCQLATHTLQDVPGYSAVSYTWGWAEEPEFAEPTLPVDCSDREIQLNGQSLSVTTNLYDLLYEFRRSYPDDINYWIDALCIDQSSNAEKAVQVNQMDKIYGAAYSVIVWLGEANSCTPRVLELIGSLANAYDSEYKLNGNVNSFSDLLSPMDSAQMSRVGLHGTSKEDWLGLIAFFQRRWFFRVWTIQEAALAQRVIVRVGTHEVEWEKLMLCGRLLGDTPLGNALTNMGQSRFRRYDISFIAVLFLGVQVLLIGRGVEANIEPKLRVWHNVHGAYSSNAALLDLLLMWLRNSSATDPRDRVFGLIGVMQALSQRYTKLPFSIQADYAKSTADVYTSTMTYVLREAGVLTIISRVQPPSHALVADMPSWVIDYSVRTPIPLVSLQNEGNALPFHAANGKMIGFRIDGNRLHVHRILVAVVSHVGETGNEMADDNTFEATAGLGLAFANRTGQRSGVVDKIRSAMTCGSTSLHGHDTSIDVIRNAFYKMILATVASAIVLGFREGRSRSEILDRMQKQDELAQMDSNSHLPTRAETERFCEEVGLLEHSLGAIDTTAINRLTDDMQPFHLIIKRTMSSRRTLLTDTGLIGLGSEDVRPGDELCIIADGGRTPLLMRKLDSGDRVVLGEAYVDGIMYGEAVAGRSDWEQICIV